MEGEHEGEGGWREFARKKNRRVEREWRLGRERRRWTEEEKEELEGGREERGAWRRCVRSGGV